MADVFISYKAERRAAAKHIASIIEAFGYTVWFDYDLVPGRNFGTRIQAELEQAKAAVVLWCNLSVRSEWVQEEADFAKERNIYLPVRMEQCGLPLGFRRDDYVDLTTWDGDPSSDRLARLLERVGELVGRQRQALTQLQSEWKTFGRPSFTQFGLVNARAVADDAPRLPTTIDETRGFDRLAAERDLRQLLGQGTTINGQDALCERWSIPKGTVAKWMRRWEDEGRVSRTQSGRKKLIEAGVHWSELNK